MQNLHTATHHYVHDQGPNFGDIPKHLEPPPVAEASPGLTAWDAPACPRRLWRRAWGISWCSVSTGKGPNDDYTVCIGNSFKIARYYYTIIVVWMLHQHFLWPSETKLAIYHIQETQCFVGWNCPCTSWRPFCHSKHLPFWFSQTWVFDQTESAYPCQTPMPPQN